MPFFHNISENEIIPNIAPGYDLLFAYKGADGWMMFIFERNGRLFFSPVLMDHLSDLRKLDLDMFFSDRKLSFLAFYDDEDEARSVCLSAIEDFLDRQFAVKND